MVMTLVVTLVTLGLSLALILPMPQEQRYYGRILAIALTYGILGIPSGIYILMRGKTFFRRDYWRFCLGLTIPVVCYNLSDLILGQSDKVMVQQMLGDGFAGRYGAALVLGGVMFTIFSALNNTWCPFFFEDMKQGKQDQQMLGDGFAGRYGAALVLGGVMFTIFSALNNTWCPFFFEDMKQGKQEQVQRKAANFLELFTVLSVGFILLSAEVYHVASEKRRIFWSCLRFCPWASFCCPQKCIMWR